MMFHLIVGTSLLKERRRKRYVERCLFLYSNVRICLHNFSPVFFAFSRSVSLVEQLSQQKVISWLKLKKEVQGMEWKLHLLLVIFKVPVLQTF